MLSNSLKTSDASNTEFFELKLFQSDQKIWQSYSGVDLDIVLDPLTYIDCP